MQTIEITGATGTGPYDVYICDITLTYCFLISGSTTIPPTVYFELPTILPNPYPPPTTITFGDSTSIIIKIVDLSSGCVIFKPYNCPSQTPTPTPTPTPTSTSSNCLCNRIDNPTAGALSFQFINCSGILTFDSCPALTSVFVCGTSATVNPGLILSVLGPCVDNSCPDFYLTPTPTPTVNPTQTPTNTPTQTQTQTPTLTSTPTVTPTVTQTSTPTNTQTPTQTNTPTLTPTNTLTNTPTVTPTNTPTLTPTNTLTNTPTVTPTNTPTPSLASVGKLFQMGNTFIYMNGDIYIFQSQ